MVEESPLPVKQALAELEDRSPQPKQFWNRIPDSVRQQHIVEHLSKGA